MLRSGKCEPVNLDDLNSIVLKQTFRPLFATVSGAHLYGFESPDSDYDLRGAFVLPLDVVIGLQLDQHAETVTLNFFENDREIDLVVHDLLKFCRLLTRKNGYVLEQLYSPFIVIGGPLLDELRQLARGCIVKHVYYHYRGFLRNQIQLASKSEGTVKEILYGYRVALTGIHLLRTGAVEAHLPTLLQSIPAEGVAELIERKRAAHEKELLAPALRQQHLEVLLGLEARLSEEFGLSPLPEDISGLPALNDFIVRVRKA